MQVFRAGELKQNTDLFKVLMNTDKMQLGLMTLQRGETSGEFGSDHPHADQLLIVLEGAAQLVLRGEDIELNEGDVVLIPAGAEHQFVGKSESAMRSLTAYAPVAYPDEEPTPLSASEEEVVSFDAEQTR